MKAQKTLFELVNMFFSTEDGDVNRMAATVYENVLRHWVEDPTKDMSTLESDRNHTFYAAVGAKIAVVLHLTGNDMYIPERFRENLLLTVI